MSQFKTSYIFILFLISITIKAQVDVSEEIKFDELKAHVNYLASDELEGRLPGTTGGQKAAEYIREQLNALNIKLLGENGFQYFDVAKGIEAGENNYLRIAGASLEFGKDYLPLSYSANGEFNAGLIFAGYGFNFKDDSVSWNDYELIDVKNKWVIILRGSPDDSHSSVYQSQSSLRKKILKAKDAGAAGVIFISGEKFDEKDELFELDYAMREPSAGLPVIQLKRNIVDKLFSQFEVTTSILEKQLNENLSPNSFVIDETISMNINLKK